MYYFAYGSNMNPEIFKTYCPTAIAITHIRLKGYRLAFTRKSQKWDGGVADLVESKYFSVWGVIYEITDESEIEHLDKKEGLGRAYKKEILNKVKHQDGSDYDFFTYTVIEKSSEEILPSQKYIDAIITGATSHKLPESYLNFLVHIKKLTSLSKGFLVIGTESRKNANGEGLINISKNNYDKLNLKLYNALTLKTKKCICRTFPIDNLGDDLIRVDQNIRYAFGIKGKIHYGFRLDIQLIKNKPEKYLFVNPRSLTLPAASPSWIDSEKNIAILHPNNIKLLGLNEGDYITLEAINNKKGQNVNYITLRSIRVFSGIADGINRKSEKISYPLMEEVYIDQDVRDSLNIPIGTPILVKPDIRKLIWGRLIFYVTSLLIAVISLASTLEGLFASIKLPGYGFIAAFLLAIILTIVLAIFDIKSRVNY